MRLQRTDRAEVLRLMWWQQLADEITMRHSGEQVTVKQAADRLTVHDAVALYGLSVIEDKPQAEILLRALAYCELVEEPSEEDIALAELVPTDQLYGTRLLEAVG